MKNHPETNSVSLTKDNQTSSLPHEWKVVKLGEAVETRKGKKPKLLEEQFRTGYLPYLTAEYFRTGRPAQFSSLEKDKTLVTVDQNDVVFIWDGSNAGDVFTGLKGILASTMVKISPDENKLLKKTLYYFLKTQFEVFNKQTTGSTIPHVNKALYENLLVPLPPLPEQKKIAAVLSVVQEAKEKTEQVISATRELKKSLMKHLFTYGAVSFEDAEKVNLKDTEIGKVPKEWDVVKLNKVFKLTSGKERPKDIIPIKQGDNIYPVYGGNGIMGYSREILLQVNTVILGRVGEYCGAVYLSKDKCWISDNALYAKEMLYNIDLNYLSLALKKLDLNRLKNKGGQPLISQSIVYSQNIPIPHILEQQKISSILYAVDEKIEAEEENKKAIDQLLKSMLHDLMTAKIRVNNLEFEV
jgi:type I restriction enzyme S subunit